MGRAVRWLWRHGQLPVSEGGKMFRSYGVGERFVKLEVRGFHMTACKFDR